MQDRIYLDHNATTPLDPIVLDTLTKHLKTCLGNPSSVHTPGQSARQVLTRCRDTVANYLNVRPQEIVFTSGGTESANLFLRGFLNEAFSGRVLTTDVEHSCVYKTLCTLEKDRILLDTVPVGRKGAPSPEDVRDAIRPDTRLIVLMAVNNETGVKTDIPAIAALAKEAGIPLFVDCVAWLGKEAISLPEGVSGASFSGHKCHAPKGVGCLFIRRNKPLIPLFTGGGQEFEKRPGTENLPGIVAFAAAIEQLEKAFPQAETHMRALQRLFESRLMQALSNVVVNGEGERVANTSNLAFLGIDGEWLLNALDREGIAASHGSACASGALEPSRVLVKMGLPQDRVRSSLRFSFSRLTTEEEVLRAIDVIIRLSHN